jgi:signal transduction histidine kinase
VRRLRLTVADDGRGFVVEPNLHSYDGHWGLLGMHERASGIGGGLAVRSAPGSGSTVTLVLPYRRRRSRSTARPLSANQQGGERAVVLDRPGWDAHPGANVE